MLIPEKILNKIKGRLFKKQTEPVSNEPSLSLDEISTFAQECVPTQESDNSVPNVVSIKWPLKLSTMVQVDLNETAQSSDGSFIPRSLKRFGEEVKETPEQAKKIAEDTDILFIPPVEEIVAIDPTEGEGYDFTATGVYVGFRTVEYTPTKKEIENIPEKIIQKPEVPETPPVWNEKEEVVKESSPLHESKQVEKVEVENIMSSIFEPESLPEHKDMKDDVEETDKSILSVFKRRR